MLLYTLILVIFGGRDAEGRTNDIHFFDTGLSFSPILFNILLCAVLEIIKSF